MFIWKIIFYLKGCKITKHKDRQIEKGSACPLFMGAFHGIGCATIKGENMVSGDMEVQVTKNDKNRNCRRVAHDFQVCRKYSGVKHVWCRIFCRYERWQFGENDNRIRHGCICVSSGNSLCDERRETATYSLRTENIVWF